MDLSFSAADVAFRDEVRSFIAVAFDPLMRAQLAISKNGYLDRAGQVRWQKALHARGWIAPDWPVEYGGAGFTPTQKFIFQSELAEAGCPVVVPMGLKMVAPVIMAFGSAEQKAQHLPSILRSDIWWAQGYSEPGSGSDLASLQMRAERKGDHYVLNGSKIWTTHAQWADWMFNLVRTSKEAKPQDGISFVLLDMKTKGVTVRSLPTLDDPIEGEQEINQVFFEDVEVPIENRIGEEGKGWTYAKYLLEFERGSAYSPTLRAMLRKAHKLARIENLSDDLDFSRKSAELAISIDALDFAERRIFSAMSAGQRPGPASSMLKTLGSDMQQAITELMLEAAGPSAMPFVQNPWSALDATGRYEQNDPFPQGDHVVATAPAYFNYRKTSIYAGSNEIQRNIMTKLVLNL